MSLGSKRTTEVPFDDSLNKGHLIDKVYMEVLKKVNFKFKFCNTQHIDNKFISLSKERIY